MNDMQSTTHSTQSIRRPKSRLLSAVFALAVPLAAMVMLVAGCGSPDVNAIAKEILVENLPEHFQKNGIGEYIKLVSVSDVTLVKENGNAYKGLANVKLRTAKGRSVTDTVQYDLKGTFDGEQLLLEFKPSDSDQVKFMELLEKSGLSLDDDDDDDDD